MTPEQATFLANTYATLMEGELPATLKVLRAVPESGRDYRPDEKSRTAWQLAKHVASADVWFLDSILGGRFTFDKAKSEALDATFSTVADVVAYYEREFTARLAQVRAASGDDMARPVDFFGMFQAPAAVLLGFANNHGIHHRGQLAAYLRGCGSKVPAIYGDSADEPMGA
jgi:uncharacterized damage-inducible protein DinB